jgi:phage tail-like protein
MPPGVRVDPYLDFRFYVEIEGIIVGGFSEVSGLEVEVATVEYEEGGRNDFTHEKPGRTSHSRVELRRGMTDSRSLMDWIRAVAAGRVERKNVFVYLLDSEGAPARGWQCTEAYPVRYAGPDLQADQGAVAVETVELTHRGLAPMELGG